MTAASLEYSTREPRTPSGELSPAIIVMHGYGANEADLMPVATVVSNIHKVISLRAPIELEWGGYAWYHLEQTPHGLRSDLESRLRSETLLMEALPLIIEQEKLDANRVVLVGFSQGAAMCYSLLSRHDLSTIGIRLEGVAAMSGYMPRDILEPLGAKNLNGLPVFISHGEFDELIPFIALDEAQSQLSRVGAKVTAEVYEMGHGIDEDVLDDLKRWFATNVI